MSKNVERHSGMTTGQRWFIIVAGTIAVFAVIGALTGSTTRSNVAMASPPTPAVAAVPTPTQAQQSTTPVEQVLAYTNGDYVVGYGQGQIAPGRYLCDGDKEGFAFSSWTAYSDSGKQHPVDFGSVGESGRRYMTVTQEHKIVSFTGDAMWIAG